MSLCDMNLDPNDLLIPDPCQIYTSLNFRVWFLNKTWRKT